MNENERIAADWERIERWVAANAPLLVGLLRPPATDEAIAATEAALGGRLPPSVRVSYRCHDGEVPESDGILNIFRLLPLAEIIEKRAEMLDIVADFQELEYDGSMIPILWGNGEFLYVDLSAEGEESALYQWWHEDPKRTVVAPSFAAYLASFADDVERGLYHHEQHYFTLKGLTRWDGV